jgi:S-formylglutathione hydrolase FrmB
MQYATRQPHVFAFAASFSGDLGAVSTGYAEGLKGVGLFVSYGNGEPGPLDNGMPSVWDPSGDTERFCEAASKVFVSGLAELNVPVTVDSYGNGTHHQLYFERKFQRSLPLILKALGE